MPRAARPQQPGSAWPCSPDAVAAIAPVAMASLLDKDAIKKVRSVRRSPPLLARTSGDQGASCFLLCEAPLDRSWFAPTRCVDAHECCASMAVCRTVNAAFTVNALNTVSARGCRWS